MKRIAIYILIGLACWGLAMIPTYQIEEWAGVEAVPVRVPWQIQNEGESEEETSEAPETARADTILPGLPGSPISPSSTNPQGLEDDLMTGANPPEEVPTEDVPETLPEETPAVETSPEGTTENIPETSTMPAETEAAETSQTESVGNVAETPAPTTGAQASETPVETPPSEAPTSLAETSSEAVPTETETASASSTETETPPAAVTETESQTAVVETEPTSEQPPATEPPVTEAPATETSATETPTTEAPATEAPTTEVPATETLPPETTTEEHTTDDADNDDPPAPPDEFVTVEWTDESEFDSDEATEDETEEISNSGLDTTPEVGVSYGQDRTNVRTEENEGLIGRDKREEIIRAHRDVTRNITGRVHTILSGIQDAQASGDAELTVSVLPVDKRSMIDQQAEDVSVATADQLKAVRGIIESYVLTQRPDLAVSESLTNAAIAYANGTGTTAAAAVAELGGNTWANVHVEEFGAREFAADVADESLKDAAEKILTLFGTGFRENPELAAFGVGVRVEQDEHGVFSVLVKVIFTE